MGVKSKSNYTTGGWCNERHDCEGFDKGLCNDCFMKNLLKRKRKKNHDNC